MRKKDMIVSRPGVFKRFMIQKIRSVLDEKGLRDARY